MDSDKPTEEEINETRSDALSPEKVEEVAASLREQGKPFVKATVVRREAPVSANVGDRAVITSDGEIIGWVGGVECARSVVVREAKNVLRTRSEKLIGLAADPSEVERPGLEAFKMTCHSGGTLEIFMEPVLAPEQVLIIGGSPVGKALARLAGELAFDVVVVDTEAKDGEYPNVKKVIVSNDPAEITEMTGEAPYVVVASMGEYDARGVAAGVKLKAPYIGLIASERRATDVIERASKILNTDPEGVEEEVTSPAGIDIEAKTPEEIAVSLLAQLIQVRRSRETEGSDTTEAVEETEEKATDPVCGMKVSVNKPPATVKHEGDVYYFCSQGCADTFSAEPEEYIPVQET
ncbi:MAG: XdhC family protein [Halobacteria archaeon]|nr:XdhC family protein [Halobacteria archaeon]